MGFRGDWKAFRQVFHFVRHYNTDEVLHGKFHGIQTPHFKGSTLKKISSVVESLFDKCDPQKIFVSTINPVDLLAVRS